MTQLWIDPTFGASGDMLLGALAGLLPAENDASEVLAPLEGLGLESFSITPSSTIRNGLAANQMVVEAGHGGQRHWSDIDALLAGADLSETVRAGARATFRRLGEVEAAQHGVTIEEVHFHEVGAIDAIVDITGTWLLLDALAVDSVIVGPVGLGHGTVKAAHGILPLPAPATLALLAGRPIRTLDVEGETCTPTGAALLVTIADEWGPIPDGVIAGSSRGAGSWNPTTHPNVVTAVLVSTSDVKTRAVMLETNVDDASAELLGHVISLLMDNGADDAWLVPIVMKKGRPAHEVRVLCHPDVVETLRQILERETGTLGTRTWPAEKAPLPRRFETVEVRGHPVSVKIGPHGAKAEFDDLVALSERLNVPFRVLAREAIALVRQPEL